MEYILDLYLDLFITLEKIKRSNNRIQRLTYHAGRCKKRVDFLKLTVMIIAELCYIKELIKTLNK